MPGRRTIRHLVVDCNEPNPALLQSAAVITRHEAIGTQPIVAELWALQALYDYPGCRLAAVINEASIHVDVFRRAAPPVMVSVTHGHHSAVERVLFASVVYALEVTGLLALDGQGPISVRVGRLTASITVRPADL